jgi:hypothetical protein
MNKLVAALVAGFLAVSSTAALAADAPKATAAPAAAAAKLEKPASVTADAWAKMTDAEKQKAVDAAKAAKPAAAPAAAAPAAAAPAAATTPKKEKKGGC